MFITIRFRSFIRLAALFAAASCALAVLGVLRSQPTAAPVSAAVSSSETVLIIDPGHGGLDGGAVGVDGTVESAVNLEIALKMREVAALFGRRTVMTREREEISYPDENASIAAKKVADQKARVELIRSYPQACLISIHQNIYPAAAVHGPQVFYRETEQSRILAEKTQELLNTRLLDNGRRVAAPISKDIFLMNQIDCTAVLVECGFLSNPEECARLAGAEYRTKIALTVFAAWMTAE